MKLRVTKEVIKERKEKGWREKKEKKDRLEGEGGKTRGRQASKILPL
jgi:hypothetical protein